MNLALLPNLCALLVFIGAFRPLARRAGPHTNAWFLAWIFILLHNAALIFGGAGSSGLVPVQLEVIQLGSPKRVASENGQ